jgi:hypothetical protein
MGRRERLILSLSFALGSWCLSLWLSSYHPLSMLPYFGFEYGNIAEALARGRGFSDCMTSGSGPTAWMPPLLPAVYALLFWSVGIRTAAAVHLAVALKMLAGGLALYVLLGWFSTRRRARVAFLLALSLWLLDWRHTLLDLNDSWLVQLCSIVALEVLRRQRHGRAAVLFSGLLPLASPALALPYALVAIKRRAWILLLPMLATSGLWGLRHYRMMGQLYPVKSNLWFDLALANLRDDDGVLTASTVSCFHPIINNPVRQQYVRLGEPEFLRRWREECRALPWQDWVLRCRNRALNAAFKMANEGDMQEVEGLGPGDIALLRDCDLVKLRRGEPLWIYMDWPESRIQACLPDCPPGQRQHLLASRRRAVEQWLQGRSQWAEWLWSYAFTLPPAAACLLLWRSNGHRRAVFLYLGFLLPYVLVQHYARYQVSMLFLQTYLVIEAAGWLSSLRRRCHS